MGTPSQLLNFPSELLILILTNLSVHDILCCSQCCKFLHGLVCSDVRLQYLIELEADGMQDGDPSLCLPTDKKLQLLLDRRKAWSKLQWKQHVTIDIPGSCLAYELVGGLFAKMTGDRIGFATTHYPISNEPPETFSMRYPNDAYRDFAFDPSQDLIIFVDNDTEVNPALNSSRTRRIHVHSISTNRRHPECRHPGTIVFPHHPNTNSFTQVAGDVIGMFLFDAPIGLADPGADEIPRLMIWDWREGVLLVDMNSRDMPPRTWDFAFLSNRAFMLTSKLASGCLCIYSFQGLPTPGCTRSFGSTTAIHHAALYLPRFARSLAQSAPVEISHITTHTAPYVETVPEGIPFYTAPSSRIHAVSVGYVTPNPQHGHASFLLIFHNRTALAYVNEDLNDGDKRRLSGRTVHARDVPWDKWGPTQTRLMPNTERFSWLRYVHGARIIYPPMFVNSSFSTLPDTGHVMEVLDFHIHPSREQHQGKTMSLAADYSFPSFTDDDGHDDGVPIVIEDSNINLNDNSYYGGIGTDGNAQQIHYMTAPDDPAQIGEPGTTSASISTSMLITESTVIDLKDVFEQDVVTSLPYRQITRQTSKKYSGFMLDQDRIIGLPWKQHFWLDNNIENIDVFTF